jgi:hypothetical protein
MRFYQMNVPSKMTPMKRLSGSFDNLQALLPRYARILDLNKAKARSIPWPYSGGRDKTRGVVSDFIRIYTSDYANGTTVAFSFSYLEGEPTVSASQKISVAHQDDQYFFSFAMSLDEFRVALNNFNKLLDAKVKVDPAYNFGDFVEIFVSQFLKNPVDEKSDVGVLSTQYTDMSAQFRRNVKALELQVKSKESELVEARKQVEKGVLLLPDSIEINRLQKLINDLQLRVKASRVDLEKTHKVLEIRSNITDIKLQMTALTEGFAAKKRELTAKVPQAIAARVLR